MQIRHIRTTAPDCYHARMDRILGQPHALEQLHAQLASARVHHAQIFHGPAGVGKFTTAVAFARTVLCHSPQTDLMGRISPCDGCESCLAFRRDADTPADAVAHPDLHIVNKELARYSDDRSTRERKLLTIPVEVLRSSLIEPAGLAPQLRHGKVFIVDEAELLNPAGQNALLKTLEEPPSSESAGGTYIVLVTSNQERLLPTIRSRCQRVAFVPLPDDVLDHRLQDMAENLEPTERHWLVGFASGSLGRAQLALDYELTGWARDIIPAMDRLEAGKPSPELGADIARCIQSFAEAWVKKHDNASKEAANKQGGALMLTLIGNHARHRIDTLAEQCDPNDPIAAEETLLPWLNVIDALGVVSGRLASNVNLALACDGLASQITMALRHRVFVA